MTDIRSEFDELVSGEYGRLEYSHESALSDFTNSVARQMKLKGLTQSDLARSIGVSRARISQVMKHQSSPTLRTMMRIADALDCTVHIGLEQPCVAAGTIGSERLAADTVRED